MYYAPPAALFSPAVPANLCVAVALQAVPAGPDPATCPFACFHLLCTCCWKPPACIYICGGSPTACCPPRRGAARHLPCPFHPRRGSGTALAQRLRCEHPPKAAPPGPGSGPAALPPLSPVGPGAGRAPGGGRRSTRSRGPGNLAPSALRHGCGGRRRLPAPLPARPGAARRQRATHQGLRAPRRHHLLQGTVPPGGRCRVWHSAGGDGGGGGGERAAAPGPRRPCAPWRRP